MSMTIYKMYMMFARFPLIKSVDYDKKLNIILTIRLLGLDEDTAEFLEKYWL